MVDNHPQETPKPESQQGFSQAKRRAKRRRKTKDQDRTEELEEATTAPVGQCAGDKQRMQARSQSAANGNLRDEPAQAGPLRQPYLDQRDEPASAGPQRSRNTQSGNHVHWDEPANAGPHRCMEPGRRDELASAGPRRPGGVQDEPTLVGPWKPPEGNYQDEPTLVGPWWLPGRSRQDEPALAGPCRLKQQDRLVQTKDQGPTGHGCEDELANARPSQPPENRLWNEPAMAKLHELFREDRSTHAEPCHQNTRDRVQSYAPEQSVRIGEAGCVPGTLERPHRSSYFLPGKLERQPVHFLIDTGCNTNLLSKRVFDHLPERVRNQLEANERYGILADGSRLAFYGILRLSGRIRDVPIEENFIVSQLNEDAILGMPFLTAHSCRMEFDRPVISLRGKELTCTDKHGRLMIAKVQAWKSTVIQPGTEVSVVCRLDLPGTIHHWG